MCFFFFKLQRGKTCTKFSTLYVIATTMLGNDQNRKPMNSLYPNTDKYKSKETTFSAASVCMG